MQRSTSHSSSAASSHGGCRPAAAAAELQLPRCLRALPRYLAGLRAGSPLICLAAAVSTTCAESRRAVVPLALPLPPCRVLDYAVAGALKTVRSLWVTMDEYLSEQLLQLVFRPSLMKYMQAAVQVV